MTLTREAITRSIFDRLNLSKAASAKAAEATFEIIKKTLVFSCLSSPHSFFSPRPDPACLTLAISWI
jgi:hypothetical protein